jgi:hypothetical protein
MLECSDSLFQRKTTGCAIGVVDSILPVFPDRLRVLVIGCLELTLLKRLLPSFFMISARWFPPHNAIASEMSSSKEAMTSERQALYYNYVNYAPCQEFSGSRSLNELIFERLAIIP